MTVAVTNTGTSTCSLSGYLELVAYLTDGKPTEPADVEHIGEFAPDPGPQPVTLASGQSAFAEISWRGGHGDDNVQYEGNAYAPVDVTATVPGDPQQLPQRIRFPKVRNQTYPAFKPSFNLTALTAKPLLLPGEPFNEDGYSRATILVP